MPQLVKGYFPNRVRWNSSLPSHWFPDGDINKTAVALSASQRDQILTILNDRVKTESITYSTKSFDRTFWRGFSCTVTGEMDPIPAPELIPLRLKKSDNSPRWQKRAETQEVIVSDYASGKAVVSYERGNEILTDTPSYGNYSLYSYDIGWPASRTGGGSSIGWVDVPGFGRVRGFTFTLDYGQRTLRGGVSPFEAGFNPNGLKESLLGFTDFEIDPDLVASVASDANKGDLDLLTFLAEMPETLRSMYDLAKRIVRIARDLRDREFRLIDKLKRDIIEDRKTRYVMINGTKVADELASLRLRYRYEIEPNIIALEELAMHFLRPKMLFTKHRKRDIDVLGAFAHSGWISQEVTGEYVKRCNCKRSYRLDDANMQFSRAFQQDLAVTAYELIPGSFILDWAFNLGDRISALGLFSEDVWIDQGFTASVQHNATNMVLQKTGITDPSGPKVRIELQNYERKVINPREHLCVIPTDGISDEIRRKLDLMAFAWISFSQRFGARPRKR